MTDKQTQGVVEGLQKLEGKYLQLKGLEQELHAEASQTQRARRKFLDSLLDDYLANEELFRSFNGQIKDDVILDERDKGLMLARYASGRDTSTEITYYENNKLQAINISGKEGNFLVIRTKDNSKISIYRHSLALWFADYQRDIEEYPSMELEEGIKVRFAPRYDKSPCKFRIEKLDRDEICKVNQRLAQYDHFSVFYGLLQEAIVSGTERTDSERKTFQENLEYLQAQRIKF